MNEPIISPWFFYFADLADKLRTLCGMLFVLAILFTLVAFLLFVDDSNNLSNDEVLANTKIMQRIFVGGIFTILFFGFSSVLIPSTSTCYKMMVTSFVTKENINIVANEANSSIDYILEKIIDTAASMQNLKAESQKEQKEPGK